MATAEEFARALGKVPVRVRECPGFLVNRILVRALVESYRRAAELGADLAAADRAVVDDGPAPMGPFALGDLIGLDTCVSIMEVLRDGLGDSKYEPCPLLRENVAAGRLGRKSGQGFYKYS